MALIQHWFYSKALTECSCLYVVIPVERHPKKTYPVLWLLPPAGYDHTAWQRRADVEQIAEREGVMAVMPDLKLSYGLDMAYGFSYFQMLTEELPKLVETYFPADPGHQMIAGAGEGAYGAMMAALRCPRQYRQVIALSGGCLTRERFAGRERRQIEHAFGTGEPSSLAGTRYALEYWLEKNEYGDLRVSLAYGREDRCAAGAGNLEKALKRAEGIELKAAVYEHALGWREWKSLLSEFVKNCGEGKE
ncbi:MAG: hypothetical protein HFG75_00690 [Hungatella sp.]|nr:hypothetical protein [Hungatella sp.]